LLATIRLDGYLKPGKTRLLLDILRGYARDIPEIFQCPIILSYHWNISEGTLEYHWNIP
jgi:hypothetical protein